MCHNQKFFSHRWLIPLILFPSTAVSFTAANIILCSYKQTARRRCGWLCASYNFFAFIMLICFGWIIGSTLIIFIYLLQRSLKNIFFFAFQHRLLPDCSQSDTLLHYIWLNLTFQCYGIFFWISAVLFFFYSNLPFSWKNTEKSSFYKHSLK